MSQGDGSSLQTVTGYLHNIMSGQALKAQISVPSTVADKVLSSAITGVLLKKVEGF